MSETKQVTCGQDSGYRSGCRCGECVAWRAREYAKTREFDKRRRELDGTDVLIDATPTARRLQALAISGWGTDAIGSRIGMHYRNLAKIRSLDHPFVKTSTAQKIAKFYRIHAHERIETRAGKIARARALTNGWHDFLYWECIEAGITDETTR